MWCLCDLAAAPWGQPFCMWPLPNRNQRPHQPPSFWHIHSDGLLPTRTPFVRALRGHSWSSCYICKHKPPPRDAPPLMPCRLHSCMWALEVLDAYGLPSNSGPAQQYPLQCGLSSSTSSLPWVLSLSPGAPEFPSSLELLVHQIITPHMKCSLFKLLCGFYLLNGPRLQHLSVPLAASGQWPAGS